MDSLGEKALKGEIDYKDIRRLYRRYKKYCRILGLSVTGLNVENNMIFWETAFMRTDSIVMRSGGVEISDGELFKTAILVGKMESWLSVIAEESAPCAKVWVYHIMNGDSFLDSALKANLVSKNDPDDVLFRTEHVIIPNMIKKTARKILKVKKSLDKMYYEMVK